MGNPACPTGPVAFIGGRHHFADSEDVAILDVVYADVDHDGAQETVARLSCGGQVNSYQVVAFDRDAAGAIVTIGQVTVDGSSIRTICGLRVGADGNVEAKVGDYPLPLECAERQTSPAQFQWRAYGYDGTRFTQVLGPPSFPVNAKVSDLKVTATDFVFDAHYPDPPYSGRYHGSMTVTVTNAGRSPMAYTLDIALQNGVEVIQPAGCTVAMYQGVEDITCPQGSLAAGATRTVTFQFAATYEAQPQIVPTARADVPSGYGDWNLDDNTAKFSVRTF